MAGHLIKRGKVWYARYYENGRRHWLSLKTNSKSIALKKFTDIMGSIERQEIGWKQKGTLLSTYLLECLASCEAEHSPKTYRVEKQVLEEFVKYSQATFIHEISASRIESYKVARSKDVSPSTVNRTLTIIKAFLNRAVRLGYIEKNPAQLVKKLKEEQKPIQFLSDAEVKKFIKCCSPRVKKIVTVFLLTGMRLGELAHLRWKDVDYRRNQILIQNQPDWTTKSYKPRVIPMHSVVRTIFEGQKKGKPESYIFSNSLGTTIEGHIRQEISRSAEAAQVLASVKMFRSTFASNLVMSGVDIYTVSKLLGHHDVKITQKYYAHLTPDFLGQSITRLNSPVLALT